VTEPHVRELDFAAVDGLAFAAERGRLKTDELSLVFAGRRLGPLLELRHLAIAGNGSGPLRSRWLDCEEFVDFDEALRTEGWRWSPPGEKCLGLLRTVPASSDNDWIAFAIDAKRAAVNAGLSDDWAAQMVGALGEFRSNVIEHSAATPTGLLAYRSVPGTFEFVASDHGVGLLSTLREAPEYTTLSDHGEALRLALTDGASRFGFQQGRGWGFRPLFTGLANRHATLRFRTGDAALVIDGTTPSLARAQIGRKPRLDGLFISVACQVAPRFA
jgi:hypothetical protein